MLFSLIRKATAFLIVGGFFIGGHTSAEDDGLGIVFFGGSDCFGNQDINNRLLNFIANCRGEVADIHMPFFHISQHIKHGGF